MATDPDPKDLYQQVIMQHNRSPVGFERDEDAPIVIEAYNPLCGDRFTLYLDWADGKLCRARFFGYGCAISKASTSVLMERIEGKSPVEIRALIDLMCCVAEPGCGLPDDLPDELRAFLAARRFPARKTCVTLSWEALAAHMRERASGKG